MTLQVAEIIDRARSGHASFHARRHPESVLHEELEAYQRRLVGRIQERRKQEVVVVEEVALPLATFTDGYAFPENKGIFQGVAYWNQQTNPTSPFVIIDEENRPRPHQWPCGYVRGSTLFLVGEEDDWTQFDRLEVPYAPEPAALTLAGDLVVPDGAELALVTRLRSFMALRYPDPEGSPPVSPGEFERRFQEEEEHFLAQIGRKSGAVAGKVRDVNPY